MRLSGEQSLATGPRARDLCIARNPGSAESPKLPSPRLLDPFAHFVRRLARFVAEKFAPGQARDVKPDVHAVEERPRQPLTVSDDPMRWALARARGVALEAARAGVRGRDEREPRRKLDRAHGPRDDHATVFERLPESLDRIATELGQLIEEQDPVVRQRALTGPQIRASPAQQSSQRDGVMRRTERASSCEPAAEQTRDRMQLRDFERLLARQSGQDRCEAPREHGLPRSRWSDHEHVVTAGRGDLERATGLGLRSDIGEVDACVGLAHRPSLDRLAGPPMSAEELDGLGKRGGTDHVDPLNEGGLCGIVLRNHDAGQSGPTRGDRYRQDAGRPNQRPAER